MKLKVFTLRMDPASGTFDDRDLLEFEADKDIIEASERFLVHEKTSAWGFVARGRQQEAVDELESGNLKIRTPPPRGGAGGGKRGSWQTR